jgi:hypothetical protein
MGEQERSSVPTSPRFFIQRAMKYSNSQFNSWRAFIAGKRGAWRREESSL